MNNYILVKLDYCWADEFDVKTFWVTTEESFNDFKALLVKYPLSWDDEFYYGTNEGVNFESSEALLNALDVELISEQYYDSLINSFGESYGLIHIPNIIEFIEERLEEGTFKREKEDVYPY